MRIIEGEKRKNSVGQLAEYKGYIGSIEYDSEDKSYYGSLINTDDFVNYCADNVVKLQEEFHAAVDDYIEFCKELKEETYENFCRWNSLVTRRNDF